MPGPDHTLPLHSWAVAILASTALLAAGCASKAPDPLAGVKFAALSGPMPAIAGPALAGGSVAQDDYAGKVVLVNFWASWCAPCTREQPALEALWKELGPTGTVAFIGVDVSDQRGPALAFARRFGVTYPSVSDPDRSIGARFHVPFLPATVLVDAHGQLRYRLVGAQDPNVVRFLIRGLEDP
jgi:thiol-disulfide isomerase/thioredoxin